MPRIARVIVPDYPHHITQRGTNKTTVFHDNGDKKYFIDWLRDYAVNTDTRIWAYCLMENHFHLLLIPEKEGSIGSVFKV